MAEKSEDTNLGFVEPSTNAKVKGIITSLSPMKSSKTCNYDDGQITDNHCSVRFAALILMFVED